MSETLRQRPAKLITTNYSSDASTILENLFLGCQNEKTPAIRNDRPLRLRSFPASFWNCSAATKSNVSGAAAVVVTTITTGKQSGKSSRSSQQRYVVMPARSVSVEKKSFMTSGRAPSPTDQPPCTPPAETSFQPSPKATETPPRPAKNKCTPKTPNKTSQSGAKSNKASKRRKSESLLGSIGKSEKIGYMQKRLLDSTTSGKKTKTLTKADRSSIHSSTDSLNFDPSMSELGCVSPFISSPHMLFQPSSVLARSASCPPTAPVQSVSSEHFDLDMVMEDGFDMHSDPMLSFVDSRTGCKSMLELGEVDGPEVLSMLSEISYNTYDKDYRQSQLQSPVTDLQSKLSDMSRESAVRPVPVSSVKVEYSIEEKVTD